MEDSAKKLIDEEDLQEIDLDKLKSFTNIFDYLLTYVQTIITSFVNFVSPIINILVEHDKYLKKEYMRKNKLLNTQFKKKKRYLCKRKK